MVYYLDDTLSSSELVILSLFPMVSSCVLLLEHRGKKYINFFCSRPEQSRAKTVGLASLY